jgi:hypothetical protein
VSAQNATTVVVNNSVDVRTRIAQLREWKREYEHEDQRLAEQVGQLSDKRHEDINLANQIATMRTRLRLHMVQEPLEISQSTIETIGYTTIRQHLVEQFVGLNEQERIDWMQNFLFIITPMIRQLDDKLSAVRGRLTLGQQLSFLIGGESGQGKTSYLDWYAFRHQAEVRETYNYVPVIKIDAPVTNRTPKPLLSRIILACGKTYLKRDNEEDLLEKIILYFQVCQVALLIIDEIQHIKAPELRRRVLEISNLTRGVPVVCASCNPLQWIQGDPEVAGRWNDYVEMKLYTGKRLDSLLAFIELLLPFSEASHLPTRTIKPNLNHSEEIAGPAARIEAWTGGVLREIMLLISNASIAAIENNLPCLTVEVLEKTWKKIQNAPANRIAHSPDNAD